MQTAKQANLIELTTIARWLCLKPYSRRAIRLDMIEPIYKIELRKDDSFLGFVLFQEIKKPLSELNAAPLKKSSAKAIAKLSAQNEKPWFALYHWSDSHFGLAKGADFFALDDLQTPKNNPEIIITPLRELISLYHYEGQNTKKIQ
jgi:hypothetical protein